MTLEIEPNTIIDGNEVWRRVIEIRIDNLNNPRITLELLEQAYLP